MIYISSDKGYVADFGSVADWQFLYEVAENQDLSFLKSFFDLGFTIDIRQVLDEVESIDWPTVNGMNEIAANFVEGLLKCSDICFLEQEVE